MTVPSDETRRSFDPNAFSQQSDVLNVLLDSLTQGIVVVGPDYHVLAFNRNFEELFQLPPGTVEVGVDYRTILKTWAEVTGQNQQMLDRAITQLDEATQFEFEFSQQIKGEPRWCLLTHNPLPGKGFVRTFTDITEFKQAEEAMKQAEWKFQALFEHGPIGVAYHRMVYNEAGQPIDYFFLDANEKYLELTGGDPRGKHVTEAFPGIEKDPFDWIGTFGRVARTGESIRFEQYLKANNRWYDCVGYLYKPDHFVAAFLEITQRKLAEQDLKKMTDRFTLASRAGGVGVWDWDVVGNHLVWDDQMYRLYGIRADQFTGAYDAWRSGLHPDDAAQGNAEIQMALAGEKDFDTEFRVAWPDGSIHFIRALATVQRDASGQPLRMVGTNWDISDRKHAEAALRESEERWKFALEGAGDGLWDWNVQTGEAYYSPRYKEMLGYTDADIGTTSDEWSKRIHPDDAPGVFAGLQPYMEGKPGSATVEFRMSCKDGSWRWIHGRGMVVSRDPDGNPIRMIGINTDITEQKKTKDALVAQSTAFAAVIDNNPMSIQILDNEGRTTRTNPAFITLFGSIPPPDYCMFSDPTLASQGLSSLFDKIRAGEVVYFPEVSYNVHDLFPEFPDSPVWVRALGFPIIDASGRPERFVLMHEDVSQRRNAEQVRAELQAQLQQSQKMESLGALAGGVAHDMNNVLGAILGLASAHIGSQPYGSPLHQALDTICKATERGGKMVRSLLNFARQNPAESNKLDMNEILKEEVKLLERTTLANVRLEIDLEGDLRPILGDANALTHAFLNLCVNAVDAMPENGTLTLRTRNVDNAWIEVVVEDNGTGMSKEVLEKAMEPFYTTKETGKGTGLGLSMVFSTVKAHRGQMTIESEPGKGTRVMMRFPACEQEIPGQAPPSTVAEATLITMATMKVLLVDDDELIQSSIQAILEVLGYTAVTTARCGEEALAMLEGGLEADLVILDMNMPGLGGIGTLPRLRVLRPEVPVLLATGRVDQTALTLASAHPGVTLLSKPFGLRELQKHLEIIGLE